MQSLRSGGFRTAVLCVAVYIAAMVPATAGQLGANKFDLMLQYTQAAPAGTDNPATYVQIHRAMGKKAIVDAQAAGLPFFRVSITGYSPSSFTEKGNDLAGWQTNPAAFWSAMDAMFNDLDAAKMQLVPSFVWNATQFPALTGESVGAFVKNPQSKSRLLLNQFIKDFITRYKSRKTILFYELTNEMNLQADQDMQKRACPANALASCVWSNFTTADMTRFGYDEVAVIKTLDPSRKISSGYAIPGYNALHLSRRPEFAPGGPDLTADSPADLDQYLRFIHTPFDIISVHIYPSKDNDRFGRPAGNQHLLVADAAASASAAGKPLFVGEFGDSAGATNFIVRVLTEIVKQRVDYLRSGYGSSINSRCRKRMTAPPIYTRSNPAIPTR